MDKTKTMIQNAVYMMVKFSIIICAVSIGYSLYIEFNIADETRVIDILLLASIIFILYEVVDVSFASLKKYRIKRYKKKEADKKKVKLPVARAI